MRTILTRLIRRGWNQRVLSDDDFDLWCEWEGVEVITARMKWDGLYFIRNNQPTILLNQRLTGIHRQIVQWHELGHHLLHVPSGRFFNYGVLDKSEYQAHVIAAAALVPRADLFRPVSELLDQGYPFEILRFRARVFDQFKI